MKIKEILFDYTNPIDIPTKNLADAVNTISIISRKHCMTM